MRILYHHRTRLDDAQGVHIGEMVDAFRAGGHDVRIVSLIQTNGSGPSGAMSLSRLAQRVSDPIYELMSVGYNAYGYRALASAIAQFRPQLIYERYALNTVCGIWASRRFRVPLILEVNAPLYREQRELGRLTFGALAQRSERWICSNSTRTIVVSGVMRDLLAAEGVPPSHMVVMPNGIDPERFNPSVSGAAMRARYGLDGAIVVGVVGWFRKWHGVEMLVESMHRHELLRGEVRLLLVGDGPAYADIRRYVDMHRLSHAVVLAGPVPRAEVAAHVAAMDVAVQPSATEYACPMKLIEYMGMGRCIVAPDQPNIREVVGDADTAYLFPRGDADALGTILRTLITDPDLRRAIGRRAHERVHARRLLWRDNANRVVELLQ
jgi:glycosyltransferase involved in cell wall biosynthesis